jgi:hypothetical protein
MGTPTFDGPEPTDPDLLPSKDDPHTGRLEERRTLREHEDDVVDNTTTGGDRDEAGDR